MFKNYCSVIIYFSFYHPFLYSRSISRKESLFQLRRVLVSETKSKQHHFFFISRKYYISRVRLFKSGKVSSKKIDPKWSFFFVLLSFSNVLSILLPAFSFSLLFFFCPEFHADTPLKVIFVSFFFFRCDKKKKSYHIVFPVILCWPLSFYRIWKRVWSFLHNNYYAYG